MCQLPSCQAGLRRQICRLRQVRVAIRDRLRRSRPAPARLATCVAACSLQDKPGQLAQVVAKLLQRPALLTPPHPGQDDEPTARYVVRHGARPGGEEPTLEKYEERAARWPLTLVKNHYSVPVEWVKTCTSSTTSLPSSRLGRASKTASPRRACLPVPELKWAKEEGGSLFHLACGQV